MVTPLNAMQAAWLRAVEEKAGKKIEVETGEDIRVLARMYTTTYPAETLVEDDDA